MSLKKFLLTSSLVAGVSMASFGGLASAAEIKELVDNSFNSSTIESSPQLSTMTAGTSFTLVFNEGYQGVSYGPWKNGTTGSGASTLTFSKSVGTSNTYTGTLTATIKDVSAAVGFNITKTNTTVASYSVKVPAGKKYTIQYRPVYKKYKASQEKYSVVAGNSTLLSKKYIYPLKFDHLEYRYTKK